MRGPSRTSGSGTRCSRLGFMRSGDPVRTASVRKPLEIRLEVTLTSVEKELLLELLLR